MRHNNTLMISIVKIQIKNKENNIDNYHLSSSECRNLNVESYECQSFKKI